MDNELLLAISGMMDEKLDKVKTDLKVEILSSVKTEIKQVETSLREEIRQVETSLREEIRQVETSLREEISDVRTELKQVEASLREEISNVRTEIRQVETRLLEEISKTNITIENVIIPNIKILAENYVPAAKKYETAANDINDLKEQVKLLNQVTSEHSEKLQLIS